MAKGKFGFKEENEIVNFGNHQDGKLTIGELIEKEPGYITWCIKNWKQFKLYNKLQKKYLAVLDAKNAITQVDNNLNDAK